MPTSDSPPAMHQNLTTLDLGDCCYGVTAVSQERALNFESLPDGLPHHERIRGLIRVDHNVVVPVFDMRTRGGTPGPYRVLIATGQHKEGEPVSFAILLDGASAAPPGDFESILTQPAVLQFGKN